jgi:hypothetical protein
MGKIRALHICIRTCSYIKVEEMIIRMVDTNPGYGQKVGGRIIKTRQGCSRMSFILWSTIKLYIYTGPPFIGHDGTLIKFMAIGNHCNCSPRD